MDLLFRSIVTRLSRFIAFKINRLTCLRLSVLVVTCLVSLYGHSAIEVGIGEQGDTQTGLASVWHDASGDKSFEQALAAYHQGEFSRLNTAGSTGLKQGNYWSHFELKNISESQLQLHLEYVDHQLISLEAYGQKGAKTDFDKITSMSLSNRFKERSIPHNRFVFEVVLEAKETKAIFVKYSSDNMGFVFPSLRIWEPKYLKARHTFETSALSFLFGGFFLMSVFALVAGIATSEKLFFAYSVYSLSKIIVWSTVLGYTHQYLITEHFHWSYMSFSCALVVFSGLVFSRMFLQTKLHTPKLDYILLLMMANMGFLFICAILKLTALTVISITIALLFYPVLAIVGVIRWRQGSKEAVVFTLAWALLIWGLVVQALRDIGFVAPTFVNYYWPPFASFTEMIAIMAAMGIKVQVLRSQKKQAEHRYRRQLENSKAELEDLVHERTKELAEAKQKAETEARTDPLTGICNRRSFFRQAAFQLDLAKRSGLSLSMLMMDIDHFKQINDQYGHAAGDDALVAVSGIISKTIRSSDLFGRVGGEEFALLIVDEASQAIELAERLRKEVEEISIQTTSGEMSFTASFGLAHFQYEDSVESFLKRADLALYEAKEGGRNKVVEFMEENASDTGMVATKPAN